MENTTPVHRKESPTVLKVFGVLFALGSWVWFLIGIPLSIFLIGIPFVIVGFLQVWLGVLIYQARKSAYVPALVIAVLSVLSTYYSYGPRSLLMLVFLAVLIAYQDSFVN